MEKFYLVIGRLPSPILSIVFPLIGLIVTVPVNTAAYTRIKEYYDFYAVPLRLISRALPQAFTQMTDYMTSADSGASNTKMLTSVPNTSLLNISNTLALVVGSGSDLLDDAGLPFVYGS